MPMHTHCCCVDKILRVKCNTFLWIQGKKARKERRLFKEMSLRSRLPSPPLFAPKDTSMGTGRRNRGDQDSGSRWEWRQSACYKVAWNLFTWNNTYYTNFNLLMSIILYFACLVAHPLALSLLMEKWSLLQSLEGTSPLLPPRLLVVTWRNHGIPRPLPVVGRGEVAVAVSQGRLHLLLLVRGDTTQGMVIIIIVHIIIAILVETETSQYQGLVISFLLKISFLLTILQKPTIKHMQAQNKHFY